MFRYNSCYRLLTKIPSPCITLNNNGISRVNQLTSLLGSTISNESITSLFTTYHHHQDTYLQQQQQRNYAWKKQPPRKVKEKRNDNNRDKGAKKKPKLLPKMQNLKTSNRLKEYMDKLSTSSDQDQPYTSTGKIKISLDDVLRQPNEKEFYDQNTKTIYKRSSSSNLNNQNNNNNNSLIQEAEIIEERKEKKKVLVQEDEVDLSLFKAPKKNQATGHKSTGRKSTDEKIVFKEEEMNPDLDNIFLKKRDPLIYTSDGKYAIRKVLDDLDGMRIDRWISIQFPVITHSLVCKLLRKGIIMKSNDFDVTNQLNINQDNNNTNNNNEIDDKLEKIQFDEKTKAGQWIYVPIKYAKEQRDIDREDPKKYIRLSDTEIKQLKESVLYKDDDIIVMNKPPGLSVQGGTGLVKHLDMMLAHLKFELEETPKLVHRLDKDTSGILILGRNRRSTTLMAAKFESKMKRRLDRNQNNSTKKNTNNSKDGSTKEQDKKIASKLEEMKKDNSVIKTYWALLTNTPSPKEGRIRAPLKTVVENGQEKIVATNETGDGAKLAITEYKVQESSVHNGSFVILWPETGRTHQLRVHCASVLNSPIIGDPKYGNENHSKSYINILDRVGKTIPLHLHARRIQFMHPIKTNKLIDVVAPLPSTLAHSWNVLGFDANIDDKSIQH